MQRNLDRLGDVLLALLAIAVAILAVLTVTRDPAPPRSSLSVTPAAGTPTPTPTPIPTPSTTAIAPASRVLLVGPDLAPLAARLAAKTGYLVQTAQAGAAEVLAPGALSTVTGVPDVVLLQVLAGSVTTTRTATAITAVRQRWPVARIFVVGPFSTSDRKSAAAAKTAATRLDVTFLDPVALDWRANAAAPTLSAADRIKVTELLAASLA